MFKKRIKAAVIACVVVCILPTISCAVGKDDFIKFLINSSYPETKSENNGKDNSEANQSDKDKDKDKEEKSESESKSSEKDYIKVHIGEENVPQIEQTSEEVAKADVINDKEYVDDLRTTNDKPNLLIYHSHGSETYSNSPENNYHSKDKVNSVMAVGSLLGDELAKKGWSIAHTTKYHDSLYNSSYATSLKTIQNIKSMYPSIDIAIDLHRDARTINDTAAKKSENKKFSTTINGEKVAKFFFVVGAKNDNFDEIKALADNMTKFAEEKYPGITMPVTVKKYGTYNQFVAKNHMLIEVGSNANSIQESKASTKYIANILDEYFKEYKK